MKRKKYNSFYLRSIFSEPTLRQLILSILIAMGLLASPAKADEQSSFGDLDASHIYAQPFQPYNGHQTKPIFPGIKYFILANVHDNVFFYNDADKAAHIHVFALLNRLPEFHIEGYSLDASLEELCGGDSIKKARKKRAEGVKLSGVIRQIEKLPHDELQTKHTGHDSYYSARIYSEEEGAAFVVNFLDLPSDTLAESITDLIGKQINVNGVFIRNRQFRLKETEAGPKGTVTLPEIYAKSFSTVSPSSTKAQTSTSKVSSQPQQLCGSSDNDVDFAVDKKLEKAINPYHKETQAIKDEIDKTFGASAKIDAYEKALKEWYERSLESRKVWKAYDPIIERLAENREKFKKANCKKNPHSSTCQYLSSQITSDEAMDELYKKRLKPYADGTKTQKSNLGLRREVSLKWREITKTFSDPDLKSLIKGFFQYPTSYSDDKVDRFIADYLWSRDRHRPMEDSISDLRKFEQNLTRILVSDRTKKDGKGAITVEEFDTENAEERVTRKYVNLAQSVNQNGKVDDDELERMEKLVAQTTIPIDQATEGQSAFAPVSTYLQKMVRENIPFVDIVKDENGELVEHKTYQNQSWIDNTQRALGAIRLAAEERENSSDEPRLPLETLQSAAKHLDRVAKHLESAEGAEAKAAKDAVGKVRQVVGIAQSRATYREHLADLQANKTRKNHILGLESHSYFENLQEIAANNQRLEAGTREIFRDESDLADRTHIFKNWRYIPNPVDGYTWRSYERYRQQSGTLEYDWRYTDQGIRGERQGTPWEYATQEYVDRWAKMARPEQMQQAFEKTVAGLDKAEQPYRQVFLNDHRFWQDPKTGTLNPAYVHARSFFLASQWKGWDKSLEEKYANWSPTMKQHYESARTIVEGDLAQLVPRAKRMGRLGAIIDQSAIQQQKRNPPSLAAGTIAP